jgi:disulfide oxidoreductase YuzD
LKNEKFKFVDRNDAKQNLNEVREKIVEEGLMYPSIPY